MNDFTRDLREIRRSVREVGHTARDAAQAAAEVTGIGGRYGARGAQIETAEDRARAAAARADTTRGVAEAQNEAFRAGAFGNPRPPIGMDNNRGYSSSTQGIPQGHPPGVQQRGGQQQPAPAPAVQPIPIAQLNEATVDLKARTDLSLKDRLTAILGAKEVRSADGRVLQGSERAAAVLNELNDHVNAAGAKTYASPADRNSAIAAARGEVKAELDRVMADPSLRHNFSAFVAEGIKTPQDKDNLQTALNNFTAVSGTENAAALHRHMQNLASPSTGRGAAAAPAVNPQLQAALQQRDTAAAAIVIKAPDGADKATKERAAALNQAYKDSLTPPAEGFAGLIQTFVKMIGHAIDPNNPRHMDSDQILKLAKSGGLKIDGEEALDRANQNLATVRQGGTPTAAAPAAPAAAAPAPATAAPAAPDQAAGEALLAERGKKLEELVVKANAGLSNDKISLNTNNTAIGLPGDPNAKARQALEKFDNNKDGQLDTQEIKSQGRAIEAALGSLASPTTPAAARPTPAPAAER